MLKAGHDEIQKTECYDNNGCPSYIRYKKSTTAVKQHSHKIMVYN